MAQSSRHLCVDIGSTMTKAALWLIEGKKLILLETGELPTWQEDISHSCIDLHRSMKGDTAKVHLSSSAHGGLNMVSIGIVPSFTEHASRQVVLSSGGKLIDSFSYRLTESDLQKIETLNPDIILFSGGTDGGNTEYVRHNTRLLSRARTEAVIIYAGNRDMADEVRALFGEQDRLLMCPNILPSLDRLQMDEARMLIRKVFLERIIEGKGLSRACESLGVPAIPTPASMYDLLMQLSSVIENVGIIDIGGATTDCYSSVAEPVLSDFRQSPVWYHGIPQPRQARSVEGDLGLRYSSITTAEQAICSHRVSPERQGRLLDYSKSISSEVHTSGVIPEYDRVLTETCFSCALTRHAGYLKRDFREPQGGYRQFGRSLLGLESLILTGGIFQNDQVIVDTGHLAMASEHDQIPLLPKACRALYDRQRLLPLAAGLFQGQDESMPSITDQIMQYLA